MNVIISWLNVNHVLRDLLLKNLNAFFDIMVLDIYKKVNYILFTPPPLSSPQKTFIPLILFINKVRCEVLEVMLTPFALNTVVSSIFVGRDFCEFNEV